MGGIESKTIPTHYCFLVRLTGKYVSSRRHERKGMEDLFAVTMKV